MRMPKGVIVLWIIFTIIFAVGAADAALRGYWYYTKPDPTIEARAKPVVNGNTDAAGISLQKWVEGGRSKYDWVPVEKLTFRRGELFFVLWDNCFHNKVDGTIHRPMIGPDKSVIWELPAGPPPKRTASGECDRHNQANLIPMWAPLGPFQYAPYVSFHKSPVESINVWFAELPPITITE